MTQETKLPNAPQRSQSFFNLKYFVFYKQRNLLMNNRSRLSQEEYTVFFSDFLDCNSARGIDDLLFILFWSFPSSVISVYFVLFHRFVAHLYVYARLVTTFLYLFLVFFLSIFTAFSRSSRLFFIHACTDSHEGSIIISSGL